MPQVPARFGNPPSEPYAFSWKNCAPPTAPIQLANLAITPDPIVLGKNVTVVASGSTQQDINSVNSVSVSLNIAKSVFGHWISIPCIENVGSCTYSDPCTFINNDPDICPTVKPYNLPCKCPFTKGSYATPPKGIPATTQNPGYSWLTDGDFQLQVTINGPSNTILGCISATFTLASK